MSNPDDATTVVRLVSDRASAQVVVKTIKSVTAELKGMGVAAANSDKRVRSDFDSAKADVRSVEREVHTLQDTMRALGHVDARPSVNIRQSGGAPTRRTGGFEVGQAGTLFSAAAGLDSLG